MENLLHLRAIRPAQAAQFLTSEPLNDELLAELVEHRLDLDVYYKVLSEEWVQKLHAAGIRINVWTVDKPDVGETLAAWGVDFITTNILE
jgi:glycerophosphoryl diester phosphodiesterase